MRVFVCPLSSVVDMIAAHTPGVIVSVLDPESTFPEPGPKYANRHLRLRFHDIHAPTKGYEMPSAGHICELITFLRKWEHTDSVLIHCRAGIGRSTATAFVAACLRNPHADERKIAAALRQAALGGVVRFDGDALAPGALVVLIPPFLSRGPATVFPAATVDGRGRYQLDGIPTGEYRVLALDLAGRTRINAFWEDPEFLREYESRGELVRFEPGERLRLDLRAIPISD